MRTMAQHIYHLLRETSFIKSEDNAHLGGLMGGDKWMRIPPKAFPNENTAWNQFSFMWTDGRKPFSPKPF